MLGEGFRWGVSSSAFQFEMGDRYRRFIDPNTDWWVWARDPVNVASGRVSGDLPEDGVDYAELYMRDHELARRLGLNIYRITVEWSRIFPCSTRRVSVDVDVDGEGLVRDVRIGEDELRALDELADQRYVEFYRRLILDLRGRGFKVIVNLHHFATPIWLHDPITVRETRGEKGPLGLADPGFVVEFAKYAAYLAWRLGDLVDMWSTFNEPLVNVEAGLLSEGGVFPPGILSPELALRAVRNIVVAHARAYDQVKRWDNVRADGDSGSTAEVGVIHNLAPVYPRGPGDGEAAEALDYLHNRYILEAWTRGLYDEDLEGGGSRVAHLGGRLDWLGVNYYTRVVVERSEPRWRGIPASRFRGVDGYGYSCVPGSFSRDGRPCSEMGWELYPEGMLDVLDLASGYGRPVYVTENGVADSRDALRPLYIVSHVAAVERAAGEGVDVRAYMYWALTDNYEWSRGFSMRFGLYEVDLETKERRPRGSVEVYRRIVAENGVGRGLRERYLRAFHLDERLGG